MINPIVLWMGGIVIFVACVLFYLLIAELFKQQQPKISSRPAPRIRNLTTRARFHNVGCQIVFIKDQIPQKALPTVVSSIKSPLPAPQHQVSQFVSASVESKLYRLLQGDRAAATRLVGAIRAKNLAKSEQWCWEKAVFDLERDRC